MCLPRPIFEREGRSSGVVLFLAFGSATEGQDRTKLWWLWLFSSVPCEEQSQHVLKLSQVLLQLALNPYQKRSSLHWLVPLPPGLPSTRPARLVLCTPYYVVAWALSDRDVVEDQPWMAGMTSYSQWVSVTHVALHGMYLIMHVYLYREI